MATDARQWPEFERLHKQLSQRYGSRSLYEGLGVKPDASAGDIAREFKEKAFKYHPDRNKEPGAEQRMKDINAINDILSKPETRANYDTWLKYAGTGSHGAASGATGTQQQGSQQQYGGSQGPDVGQKSQHQYQQPGAGSSSYRSGTGRSRGRSGVFVNGVELPQEFRGASRINNIAISADGKWFAIIRNGRFTVSAMPSDGKIKVDGYEIKAERGNVSIKGNGVHVSQSGGSYTRVSGFNFGGIHFSSVRSSGGSVFNIGDDYGSEGLDCAVDRMYEQVQQVSVTTSNDIMLGRSGNGKVHVQGTAGSEPEYDSGKLSVRDLEGKILLPRDEALKLDIRTSGDVVGEAVNGGSISASGDISLRLYAPLAVSVSASGDTDVIGMVGERYGLFTPPNQSPVGTLHVKASGDINIVYMLGRR